MYMNILVFKVCCYNTHFIAKYHSSKYIYKHSYVSMYIVTCNLAKVQFMKVETCNHLHGFNANTNNNIHIYVYHKCF